MDSSTEPTDIGIALVRHLRTTHLALVAACFAITAGTMFQDVSQLSRAVEQARFVGQLASIWGDMRAVAEVQDIPQAVPDPEESAICVRHEGQTSCYPIVVSAVYLEEVDPFEPPQLGDLSSFIQEWNASQAKRSFYYLKQLDDPRPCVPTDAEIYLRNRTKADSGPETAIYLRLSTFSFSAQPWCRMLPKSTEYPGFAFRPFKEYYGFDPPDFVLSTSSLPLGGRRSLNAFLPAKVEPSHRSPQELYVKVAARSVHPPTDLQYGSFKASFSALHREAENLHSLSLSEGTAMGDGTQT